MGNHQDAADARARATADDDLARQDWAATEALSRSAANLDLIASTMADQGNEDAAAVLHRAASQQLHEGVRHALQGEYLQDAAIAWGGSSTALGEQARESDQSHAYAADLDGRVAQRLGEPAIEAEAQAHKIHPEVPDDGAIPEPPVPE